MNADFRLLNETRPPDPSSLVTFEEEKKKVRIDKL